MSVLHSFISDAPRRPVRLTGLKSALPSQALLLPAWTRARFHSCHESLAGTCSSGVECSSSGSFLVVSTGLAVIAVFFLLTVPQHQEPGRCSLLGGVTVATALVCSGLVCTMRCDVMWCDVMLTLRPSWSRRFFSTVYLDMMCVIGSLGRPSSWLLILLWWLW